MKTNRAFLFNTCEVAPFFQNIFRSTVFPGSWEFFSSGEKDFVHGKGRYFFRLPPGWLQNPLDPNRLAALAIVSPVFQQEQRQPITSVFGETPHSSNETVTGMWQNPGRTCGAACAPQGERAYEVTGQ